jgi:hypothetical protein
MDIDQKWVEENISDIMDTFCKINPQFKSKDNASQSAKRRHKKNMLESMDTVAYRPIYRITRFTKIKELRLRKLIREKHNEIQSLETCNSVNAENLEFYKEKSCKLAEENMMLRKRIQKLESKMQCLAQQGMKLPNQPNQPCGSKEDETDDVY